MSSSKSQVYNLALSALLLAREIVNPDTDTSNEARVLNLHWDSVLSFVLQDLDLDSLSTPITLELIEEIPQEMNSPYNYAYKYPDNCAFLRRLVSGAETDNITTHISKRVGIYKGQKAIFTNELDAVAECLPDDVPIPALPPMAVVALSQWLAYMAAPLITGKGAQKLRDSILLAYEVAKTKAQEADAGENFNYEDDSIRSEWVLARIE